MQGKSTEKGGRGTRRPRGLAACAGIAAGFCAATAAAAGGVALPMIQARDAELNPGTWVSYAVHNASTGQGALVRLAALEREGAGQWFEVGITDQAHRRMVYKVLIEGPLAAPSRVVQAIVQPPEQRALVLPSAAIAGELPRFSLGQLKDARLVGAVRVKVAAGTFAARLFRRQGPHGTAERSWIADKVPGWPMVKYESARVRLELVGFGKDAKTQITGQPVKLDPRFLGGR